MSQHDYNIANQTFSATRTDLNNALGAVATNNAGNSAPSTTYANQWWFDSDGNTLYMRNKDNDAWVRILEIGATSDETQRFGENIYVDSSGNVGIGESTPDTLLHIKETINVAYSADNFTIDANALLKLENPSTTGAAFSAIAFRTGSGADLYFGGVQGSGNEGAFKFARQGSPDQELLEIAHNGATTITTADNTNTLTLKSTDADAVVGPNLKLYRNSGSPADNDTLGQLSFVGRNDNSQDFTAFQMNAYSTDVSDGTEDGTFRMYAMQAGSQHIVMQITPTETVFNDGSVDQDFRVESNDNANMLFVDGGNDKVGIGQSDPNAFTDNYNDLVVGTHSGSNGITIACQNNAQASLAFSTAASGDSLHKGRIAYDGANNFMSFSTDGASEKMRITSSGQVSLGTSSPVGSSRLFFYASASTPYGLITQNDNTVGSMYAAQFLQNDGSTELGSIKITNTATAFNTSSDYRLKENVDYTWDATTRLKQLKPARFNFIADADTTVDGFLAHEVSSIVPEAISGDKDATETKTKVVVNSNGFVINQDVEEADWIAGKIANDDGNTRYPTDSTWAASKVVPKYQGIDQSKLVPLLVKTIQELEARITTLEG